MRPASTCAELRDLGATLAREWARQAHREEAFSELALGAARSWLREAGFSLDRFGEELAVLDDLPEQGRLDTDFGQPPLTVYRDERFRIDLLFWAEGTTGIHQHAFSGAFGVVSGSSVHSTYGFRPEEGSPRIGSLLTGRVALRGTELLSPGDARPITAGSAYVHSLFHLDAPTVSLVVRTHVSTCPEPEYEYKPPSLAIDPSAQTVAARKRLQFVRMLWRTGSDAYEGAVSSALENGDAAEAFGLLAHVRARVGDGLLRDRLTARARKALGGELVDRLVEAADEEGRRAAVAAARARVREPELRYFLALVLNLPDRTSILDLASARHTARDPVEWVLDCVAALAEHRALGVHLTAEVEAILRALLRSADAEEAVRDLARRHRADDTTTTAVREVVDLLATTPVLRPLLR